MKKLLLPVALMLMSSAYAQTCLEQICTGDVVINTSDSVGSVVGVVDNKLIYRVGSYEYRALPSELSKEEADANFTKGKTVINSNDSIGTVLYTFADKRIQYSISGYKYVSNKLAFATSSYGDLSTGVEVINTNDSIGTVTQTFSDGRVQYSLSGYKYVTPANNLSKAIETIDGLKAGTIVINTNESIGNVVKMFKNGKVQYSLSGYKYVAQSSALSPAVSEVDGIKAGATVINTNDSIGIVMQLFANKKIQYSLSGYKYVTDSNNLSLENTGLGTVKTGSIVLTNNDSIARVNKTFDNQKVQYSLSGYNYVNDLSTLSPEVETHPIYKKDEAYAINRTIGKAVYFFANEKAAIKTESGSFQVSKDLAAEVPSLGRVSEGNTIVTSFGSDVKVLRLFENNTVEVEEKSVIEGKEVTKKRGITLILNASEMSENQMGNYAYDIYRKLEGEKVFYYGSLLEEVTLIKKKIAADVKDIKKQFYMEKKLYKKFLEEVGATDDSVDNEDDSNSSGPVSEDTFFVKMNTTELKGIVVKELQKRNVSYAFTDKIQEGKTINITIERDRKVPFTKCMVKVDLIVKKPNMSMTMSSARKKSVLGWGKNSCKSVVKKVLRQVI